MTEWKRKIGLADYRGSVVELECYRDGDGDVAGSMSIRGGAFGWHASDPDPAALRQLSAAVLDLADRMEAE